MLYRLGCAPTRQPSDVINYALFHCLVQAIALDDEKKALQFICNEPIMQLLERQVTAVDIDNARKAAV